jgi:hypothetical protein
MDQFRLSEIDLLKVDIEGSEIEVFGACDFGGRRFSAPLPIEWAQSEHAQA